MLRKASTKTPTRTFQFSENFQVVVSLSLYAATVLVQARDLCLASGAIASRSVLPKQTHDKPEPSLPMDGQKQEAKPHQ